MFALLNMGGSGKIMLVLAIVLVLFGGKKAARNWPRASATVNQVELQEGIQ